MKLNQLAAVVAAATLITACGSDSSSSSSEDKSIAIDVAKVKQVVDTNADIAYAAYSDSVTTAKELKTALENLRTNPTDATLEAAKKAWLVAREPYGQTEVYRFRNSPIDSTDYSAEDGPEGDINAWPLGEALIDYVQTNNSDFGTDQIGVTANQAGINGGGALTADGASTDNTNNIIGDTSITINDDLLANTATADDEHDVIAGYHAIEFMLWGQDLNTTNQSTTNGTDRDKAVNVGAMGGQRPLADFQPGYGNTLTLASAEAATQKVALLGYDSSEVSHRRHKFMEVAVDKLIADLESVRDGWKTGATYRTAFTTVETEAQAKQKLAEIMTGMGTLSEGELAGERMQIAFSSNSQEDEHSCFSDNTHRDIWLNAEGVSNSYYGTYAGYDSTLDGTDNITTNKVSGYGLNQYLKDVGATAQAITLETALTATAAAYNEIDSEARAGNPFDVLIMEANRNADNPVYKTIVTLNAQSKLIASVADNMKLDTDVVDDDASGCDTENPTQACE
jgi:putative iron-regulated protein